MNFWRLVPPDQFLNPSIVGHHSHSLCFFASLLAVMAALVLLPVAHRYHYGNSRYRRLWLVVGSLGMGAGIWAMHFTAMLAYSLPFDVSYDLPTTIISIAPAMIASCSCIVLYQPEKFLFKRQLLSALILALGVAGMHYLGMEALVVPAEMYYHPDLFIWSLVVGYLLSVLGLSAHHILSASTRVPDGLGVLIGSVLLGAAVSATHFIAMEATHFQFSMDGALSSRTIPPYTLMAIIASIIVALLAFILVGAFVDKKIDLVKESLKNSEERFQQLAISSQSAIFTFDAERIRYANPALAEITGYSTEVLTNRNLSDLFGSKFNEFIDEFFSSGKACVRECEIITEDKQAKWLYFSLTPTDLGETSLITLGSAIDVTDRKRAVIDLQQVAYTDQLTGLANRRKLIHRLKHHLVQINQREIGVSSCLVMLDLNKFKQVNDTFGHRYGDNLLKRFGLRLRHFCQDTDIPARVGGDEFVILLDNIRSKSDVDDFVVRLHAHLCRPINLGHGVSDIQVSIGVLELESGKYVSVDDAIRDVDIALYRAKERSDTNWVRFDNVLGLRAKRSRLLQLELKEAVQNKSLNFVFQPIVDVVECKIIGFECLCRWQRDNGEHVSPQEFIPLAEGMGLVSDIGLWATEVATKQLAEWTQLPGHSDLYVSVNLASISFTDERLYELLTHLISKYKLQTRKIKLELTESILMLDTEVMCERLQRLTEMGCDIVIDDFGTGYSSLAYLHQFPAAILKIDRSFVNELGRGIAAASIVRTIAGLAANLNMSVICEGVETEPQEQLLLELGCSVFQGYLYGKPMPSLEATKLLSKNFLQLKQVASNDS